MSPALAGGFFTTSTTWKAPRKPHLRSVVTLNVNGISIPIKGRDWHGGFKKHNLTVCYLQETYLKVNDIGRLRAKESKPCKH